MKVVGWLAVAAVVAAVVGVVVSAAGSADDVKRYARMRSM